MYADPEHGGMRVAVLGVIGVGLVLFFSCCACCSDLVPAGTASGGFHNRSFLYRRDRRRAGLAYFVEKYLKRVWHSGLVFDPAEDEAAV